MVDYVVHQRSLYVYYKFIGNMFIFIYYVLHELFSHFQIVLCTANVFYCLIILFLHTF